MNPWTCIIGRGDDGKRSAVSGLVNRLRLRGLKVGGALSETITEVDRELERIGYDLVDLVTGSRTPLARQSVDPDMCDLSFHWSAFDDARGWVENQELDVVFLEAGKLESSRKGNWEALQSVLGLERRAVVVLCVRPDRLTGIALQLEDPGAYMELPYKNEDLDTFTDEIVALLASRE